MPLSKARKTANAKYNAKAYEQLPVRVAKGQKNIIQAHATARKESLNGFVNRAVNETMERDNSNPATEVCTANIQLTPEEEAQIIKRREMLAQL